MTGNRADSCSSSKVLRAFLAALLSLLLAFSFSATVSVDPAWAARDNESVVHKPAVKERPASENPAKVVRVGYYPRVDFQEGASDDDRKSGYAYDFYQAIAPFAGWKYEYVYLSQDEAIETLKKGDVDIVAGVEKNPAYDSFLLYPDRDLGVGSTDRYFAINRNTPELLDDLNFALEELFTVSPRYADELWMKYYEARAQDSSLTPGEVAYLQKLNVLHLGYLDRNLPISGSDEKGNPSGVVGEIIPMLEESLGTSVQATSYTDIDSLENDLRAGKIDVIFPVFDDVWLNESKQLYQTDPIVDERIVVAYLGEYNDTIMDKVSISRAAMGRQAFIAQRAGDTRILTYDTRKECFDAVLDREVNSTLGCASVMQRFIAENPEYSNMNIAYLEGTDKFSFAVSFNNSELAGILQKVTKNFDSALITNSIIKYSYVATPYTVVDVIQQYAIPLLVIALVVVATVILVFIRYRKRVNKFNKEQAETRAALEEALDSADNASAAKTSFLSNMSHDIRTPLNGIIGMTAIAGANIDDKERVKDCLAKITASGKHLLALINEILDVSKIESGHVDLSEEDFNLAEMMNDLVTMNKPLADEKNQKMLVRVKNVTHELVVGDRVRLQQVVTNLVSNAIKYTPNNGMIDVTLEERPSGSPAIGCFDFIVKDNGIGMSEDYLPHIFEAFSRAQDRNATRQQGTGLGMPIAQNIVRMMNGDIKVESELGKGSTFTATVFLKLAEEDTIPYEEFIDLNVLIVDDDVDVCESTCLLLGELGMNCEYVTSGREAIDLVVRRNEEQHDYFAIVIDWVMPEMDGIETIKEIRARVGDEIPIVVISAYDWSEIEVRAREAGAQFFVGKPLFKSRLTHLFAQILGKEEAPEVEDLDTVTGQVNFIGKRALLAEDNDLNAEVAMEFLGMTGLEIQRAVNGEEAVAMVNDTEPGHYDCIFMDIQMPIMNGYDAAKAIRDLPREDTNTIPIFAMTADAFVDDVQRAKDTGMNEHFAKPLDFDTVIQVVNTYISTESQE